MRWSREDIVKAIRDWADLNGRPPKHDEWRHAGASHPGATTVKRHFGTWNAAIHAAGFQPRSHWQPRRM